MEIRLERIPRLEKVLENVRMKGDEKCGQNDTKFRSDVRNLRELRQRLQNSLEFPHEKESELLALRED
jgi:hypothetical protein